MNPIRLLLVDDEKAFVEVVSQRLQRRGFKVDTVFTGRDAIALIEVDKDIDVVILVAMPGMDGIEALRKIKRTLSITEVIMLTGHATVQSVVNAINSGAFDYAMKPIELDDLIAKVNAAASRKRERENKILEIRMRPYLTKQERDELIARILKG